MEERIGNIMRWGFALIMIVLGAVFNFMNLGMNNNLGFGSVGNWMIFVGCFAVIISLFKKYGKKRQVDERMLNVAYKSARVSFVLVIFFAFIVMVMDSINPITVSYTDFMSHFIMGFVLSNLAIYKIMLRYS